MLLGLAVSYFFLYASSERRTYADGTVPPEFCLARECLKFSRGRVQVELGNRSTATAVQVRFVASKCNQNRAGCTITRTRLSNERETEVMSMGAVEVLLQLLDVHPQLTGGAPLTVRVTSRA